VTTRWPKSRAFHLREQHGKTAKLGKIIRS